MIEKFQQNNQIYLSKRKILAEQLNIPNLWTIIDQFGLYAGIQTIGTRLAVYEVMKQCLNIPGHIMEFGCWKGTNLLFMAKVLQLLQPNTFKHIYGFDSFEGLQTFSAADGETKGNTGQYIGNESELLAIIEFFEMSEWVHIIKGNALDTIPRFEKDNYHLMISMAYIDFDLYEPCKAALEFVAKRLSTGGIIVFDEALTHLWPGEGLALVEFLSDKGANQFTMHNVSFARQPTVYLIKK